MSNNSKQTTQQRIQENIMKAQQGHKQVEGDTIYTFENHRNHDLSLPRKSFDEKTLIPPRGRFKGDSYFLMLMKTGYVRLVGSEPYIRTPAPAPQQASPVVQEQAKPLNESQENKMEKLILDQPEKFTARGHSEAVNVSNQPQVESCKSAQENANASNKNNDVLLTENPLDGIDIITG
jgi:hypothetical protein